VLQLLKQNGKIANKEAFSVPIAELALLGAGVEMSVLMKMNGSNKREELAADKSHDMKEILEL
jgi:hypothetical protein